MMKKIIFFFSLIFTIIVQSGDLKSQTFKPGIFGGIVTSQVGGDGYAGFNKLGVTFGGFVRYSLNEQWSMQFEIAYVQKGSRNSFSITTNDASQSSEFFLLRLNYIEIPLLFKFDHNNIIYEGGLYYGQLASAYMEFRNDNGSGKVYRSLDEMNAIFDKDLKNYDFGIIIGVGYKITDNILGSVRFSNSLIAIKEFESGKVDTYPTSFRIGLTNTVVLGTIRFTFGEGDELHKIIQKAE